MESFKIIREIEKEDALYRICENLRADNELRYFVFWYQPSTGYSMLRKITSTEDEALKYIEQCK